MKKKLYDISGKIDLYRLGIIESIKEIADTLDIPFFIVGATARDIILEHIFSKKNFRATNDIDFGIRVNNWKIFEYFTSALVQSGKYSPDKNVQHRFLYEKVYPIDVVPFGKVASDAGNFKWPKEVREFTVLGFEEAYENSDLVKVKNHPEIIVKFAAPHCLALLKIISWNERYPERSRDALDLVLLVESYLEMGNRERLYDDEADLVDEKFDFVFSGARLLGRDIASVFQPNTLDYVIRILDRETEDEKRYKLVEDMMRSHAMTGSNHFDYFLNILKTLKTGILERYNKN